MKRLLLGSLGALIAVSVASPVAAQRSRPFRLRVVDARGRPVRGADVRVTAAGERIATRSYRSDRRGRVRAPVGDVGAGVVVAVARAEGGRLGATDTISMIPCAESDCYVPGIDTELELTVEAPARVEGRVLGPFGQPLAGARVTLRWIGAGQGTSLHGLFQDEALGAPGRLRRVRHLDELAEVQRRSGLHPVTRTAEDGTYALAPPRGGVYAVLVDAPGTAAYASGPVQLIGGQTTTSDHRLGHGFSIVAQVRDAQGRPARGGTVEITDGCERAWVPIEGGRAVFAGVPAGRYHVWATVAGQPAGPRVEVEGRIDPVRIALGGSAAPRPLSGLSACAGGDEGFGDPWEGVSWDEGPVCGPPVELYPLEGEQVVVRVWERRARPPLREGDVVQRIDGDPAPRGYYGRCGSSATWTIRRPATGETLTVRVPRSRPPPDE